MSLWNSIWRLLYPYHDIASKLLQWLRTCRWIYVILFCTYLLTDILDLQPQVTIYLYTNAQCMWGKLHGYATTLWDPWKLNSTHWSVDQKLNNWRKLVGILIILVFLCPATRKYCFLAYIEAPEYLMKWHRLGGCNSITYEFRYWLFKLLSDTFVMNFIN